MKNIIYLSILAAFILLSACENDKLNPDNTSVDLSGKIKTLIKYNQLSDTFYEYQFYYDSTGFLNKVTDDTTLVLTMKKVYSDTILFYDRLNQLSYKILVNDNKKILSIIREDAGFAVTEVFYNGAEADSIFDVGLDTYCNFFKIKLEDGNCTGYSTSYIDFFSSSFQQYDATMEYTSILNDYQLPNQCIVGGITAIPDVYTYLGRVIYYMGINGYHTVRLNKNLILKQHINGGTVEYSYVMENNKVIRQTVQGGVGTLISDITYY